MWCFDFQYFGAAGVPLFVLVGSGEDTVVRADEGTCPTDRGDVGGGVG